MNSKINAHTVPPEVEAMLLLEFSTAYRNSFCLKPSEVHPFCKCWEFEYISEV